MDARKSGEKMERFRVEQGDWHLTEREGEKGWYEEEGMCAWKRWRKRGEGGKVKKERISASVRVNSSER